MSNQQESSDSWLKLGDAAFALGVSEITLRRKIKTGRIPFELRDGKYFVQVEEGGQAAPAISAPRSTPAKQSLPIAPQRPAPMPTPTLSTNHFSHTLMSATMNHAHLQSRIDELEQLLCDQEETIFEMRRQFEDQQTLIAFLEDRLSQFEN